MSQLRAASNLSRVQPTKRVRPEIRRKGGQQKVGSPKKYREVLADEFIP
jgi:hypothetical protein